MLFHIESFKANPFFLLEGPFKFCIIATYNYHLTGACTSADGSPREQY